MLRSTNNILSFMQINVNNSPEALSLSLHNAFSSNLKFICYQELPTYNNKIKSIPFYYSSRTISSKPINNTINACITPLSSDIIIHPVHDLCSEYFAVGVTNYNNNLYTIVYRYLHYSLNSGYIVGASYKSDQKLFLLEYHICYWR